MGIDVSKDFKEKFLFVYPTFLKLFFGIIIGYSLVHWFFFIELGFLSVKEHILNFYIPIALSALGLVVFLRPKLDILKLNNENKDIRFQYYFLFSLALTIPNIIAQDLLVSFTGTLSEIESIHELEESPPSRYYRINHFELNLNNIKTNIETEVSGRFNDEFNLSIYLVAPIYNQLKDTNSTNPSAWFGIKYHKSINNSLELAQKRRLLESFIIDSRLNFKLKDFSSVDYYEKLNNSGLRDNYYKAINQNDKLVGNYTVLIPNYEIFESRNNGKITWLVITIIIALLGVIVMIHYPEINKIKKRKMKFNLSEEFSLLKEFTLPEKGTKVTYFLILINVLIFLSMTISGLGFIAFKGSDLILWGANDWFSVSHGDYWRLLTSVFLHAGIMHLGSNLAMLYLIGNFLESRMGSSLFLIAYIITGILASITSFFWHENVLSVGASGAIFGLLGVWLVLLIRNVFPQKLKYEQLKMVTIIIVINLLFGLSDRIDNAGHIGGLISGLILGFALLKEIKVKVKKQDMLKYKGTKK